MRLAPTQTMALSSIQKICLSILLVLSLLVSLDHMRRWFTGLPPDLRAFYAAGQVIDQHANPFTVQPLLNQERSLTGPNATQDIVAPVPLPPYDLVAFGLFARLPVHLAAACTAAATIAAGVAIGFALFQAAEIPLLLAIAAAFEAVIYAASGLGQIAPIAIALLAIAIWAVRTKRYNLAGICVAVSLIQPQIALGAVISTALFVPRARVSLILCVALALLTSFIVLPHTIIAQYTAILGIHALAEIHFPAQYSLTWLAVHFGTSPKLAIALGGASTVLALVLSLIIVAQHCQAALMNGAVIALPAAFAVLGGSFIHEHQLALAFIPALFLLRTTRSLFDSNWALAIMVLPFSSFLTLEPYWPKHAAYPSIALAFAICWTLVFYRSRPLGNATAMQKSTVITIGLACLFLLFAKLRPIVQMQLPQIPIIATENASLEWAVFCESANTAFHSTWYPLLVKLPVWLSAIAIAVCTARNVEQQ